MSLKLDKEYPESLKNVKPTFMRALKSGDVVIDETGDGEGDLIIATPNTDIEFMAPPCDETTQTEELSKTWGTLSRKAIVLKFLKRS